MPLDLDCASINQFKNNMTNQSINRPANQQIDYQFNSQLFNQYALSDTDSLCFKKEALSSKLKQKKTGPSPSVGIFLGGEVGQGTLPTGPG